MRKKYSDEVRIFIAENVEGRRNKELAELVNSKYGTDFTNSSMSSYKKNNRLKNGLPTGVKSVFPEEVVEFAKENHIGVGPTEMARILSEKFNANYSVKQISNLYGKHGLDSGVKGGQFEKGIVPWNKGLKGLQTGGKETRFKKGQIPPNRREIGDERVDTDGYTYVKIQDGHGNKNWKLKHNLVWEKHHGPIPKKHTVIFGNADKTDFNIDNLILVTRHELLTMNKHGLIKSDTTLTKTGVLVAKLHNKISKENRRTNV